MLQKKLNFVATRKWPVSMLLEKFNQKHFSVDEIAQNPYHSKSVIFSAFRRFSFYTCSDKDMELRRVEPRGQSSNGHPGTTPSPIQISAPPGPRSPNLTLSRRSLYPIELGGLENIKSPVLIVRSDRQVDDTCEALVGFDTRNISQDFYFLKTSTQNVGVFFSPNTIFTLLLVAYFKFFV